MRWELILLAFILGFAAGAFGCLLVTLLPHMFGH